MTWLYLSLGAAVCYTCLSILSRIVSVDSKNPRALALAFNLVSIAMAVLLIFFTGAYKNFSFPMRTDAWVYFFIAAFFYGIFERLRFDATKLLDASTYSIISNSTIVVAFVLSIFLYQETLTFSKILGFCLILISLFLVIERRKTKVSAKGIIIGLITSITVGIGMGLDKKGVIFFNPEIYNLILWTVPFVIIYFPGMQFKKIMVEFKQFSWKIVLLSLFNSVGYYLGLKAFLLADATKVIPIMQLSTIMTVIAGILFLNERSHVSKKILAGIIAVAGVFLLR